MENETQSTMTLTPPAVKNPSEGEQLKEQCQKQIARHNNEFITRSKQIVHDIAKTGDPFKFDEVRLKCEREGIIPAHPNAWGALPRSCRDFIKLTDSAPSKSSITSAHSRKLPWYVRK